MWIHNFVTVTLVLHGPINVVSTTNTHTHTHKIQSTYLLKFFRCLVDQTAVFLWEDLEDLWIYPWQRIWNIHIKSLQTQVSLKYYIVVYLLNLKRLWNEMKIDQVQNHINCSLSSTKLTRLALTSVLRPFGVHWSTFLYICAWFNAAHFIVHLSKLWVQLGGWTDRLNPQTPNTI